MSGKIVEVAISSWRVKFNIHEVVQKMWLLRALTLFPKEREVVEFVGQHTFIDTVHVTWP